MRRKTGVTKGKKNNVLKMWRIVSKSINFEKTKIHENNQNN